ncbi:MAG: hypothetical protein E6Q68_01780 [Polynucleobacter sp.]|nr:MAG: hypothetical protein E6Q68_01780 [Polynucleobacter sp.]
MERNLTDEKVVAIAKACIKHEADCRVYMHLAGITFGRFVMDEEFEELLQKGYLRFLHKTQYKNYDNCESAHAKKGMCKLIMVSKICDILTF